jgi:hypothetical protein
MIVHPSQDLFECTDTFVRAVENKGDGGDSGSMKPAVIIGITLAGVLVLAAVVTALCCCFNDHCACTACGGQARAAKRSAAAKDVEQSSRTVRHVATQACACFLYVFIFVFVYIDLSQGDVDALSCSVLMPRLV